MPENRPGAPRSVRGELERAAAERAKIRRDRTRRQQPKPFVKLDPDPAEHWPPGTAWLDTSPPQP